MTPKRSRVEKTFCAIAERRLAGRAAQASRQISADLVFQVAKQCLTMNGWSSAWLEHSQLAGLRGEPARWTPEERAGIEGFASAAGRGRGDVAHRVGLALDLVRSQESVGKGSGDRSSVRRRNGSYYTSPAVARAVVQRSRPWLQRNVASGCLPTVCDPACGGGAFLVEAALLLVDLLSSFRSEDYATALNQVLGRLHAVDRSQVALATCRAALSCLLASTHDEVAANGYERLGARGHHGDALDDKWPERLGCRQFDWVVTNPPWVAYMGRAAQHLEPEVRADLRSRFRAFAGYPTLHGVFMERAVQLAPSGLVSLLLPSSVADLDGYAAARAAVTSSHCPLEPLHEFGQDAFDRVVQPCFALIAEPRDGLAGALDATPAASRPWRLEERRSSAVQAEAIQAPAALLRQGEGAPLPDECFKERGFQSNSRVVERLFLKTDVAQEPFVLPLLQGRNVSEFSVRRPTLHMNPDPASLRAAGARLRDPADYQRVSFVVRQTAAYTIAAAHDGSFFRNSLIAGFEHEDLDAPLLVGLLNSAFYRALHVSRQRDARQAAFPQVKLAHLRGLPRPPNREQRDMVRHVSLRGQAEGGLDIAGRQKIDAAVFDLFELTAPERDEVCRFLEEKAPRALAPSLRS